MADDTITQLVGEIATAPWTGAVGAAYAGTVCGIANDVMIEGASKAMQSALLYPVTPRAETYDQPPEAIDLLGRDALLLRYPGEDAYTGLRPRVRNKWAFWQSGIKAALLTELAAAGYALTQDWVFDGVNDTVTLGNVAALEPSATAAWSIDIWAIPASLNGCIYSKQGAAPVQRGLAVVLIAGQVYAGIVSDATGSDIAVQAQTTATVAVNQLVHITVTCDGSTDLAGFKIYIDAASQGFSASTDNLASTDSVASGVAALIGSRNGAEFFAGRCKVAFITKALSAAEVVEAHALGSPPDLRTLSFKASVQDWWQINTADSALAGGVRDYGSGSHAGTTVGGLGSTTATPIPIKGATGAQILVPNDFSPLPPPSTNWSRFWLKFPAGTHPVTGTGGFIMGAGVVGATRLGPAGLQSAAGEAYLGQLKNILARMKPVQWVAWNIIFEVTPGALYIFLEYKPGRINPIDTHYAYSNAGAALPLGV